jgi:hypothetical protein
VHKSVATCYGRITSAGLTMTSYRVLHCQFHVKQAHIMYVAIFLGTELECVMATLKFY